MVRKLVLSLIAVLSVCAFAFAQNKQVSGTVVGPDGLPVIGATIMVEGTGIGTSTDGNGKFVISAPADGILAVSCIGYTNQQIPVSNRTALDIVLEEDAEAIADVVIVGYGTGRKVGTVIGSVDQVKSEKLEARPTNNVMDAMQGQVAGLQIMSSSGELNQASTIRLHGVGSLQAGNEPLILLDGAPISSSNLLAMNPNDIAAITTLKDASATSIYGSRAANGVIYVTSKKGARGEEGAVVTLRTQYSFSNMIRPRLNPMNTEQLLNYQGALVAADNNMDYNDPANVAWGRDQVIATLGIDPSVDVDWFDEIMKSNAPLYQVDLSVSGGSQRTSYYFSGSYYDQQGVMPGSTLDRYSFRSNIETKANNWLKMGLNLSMSYQDARTALVTPDGSDGVYPDSPMMGSLLIQPYQRATDDNGNPLYWLDLFNSTNPAYMDKWMTTKNNRLQLNGSAFVELTPVEGLTVRSQLSANAFDYRATVHGNPDTPTATGVTGTTYVQEGFQRMYAWTWTNTAEYKFTVADDHHFTALLGEETIYGNNEAFNAATNGVTNSDLLYISQGTEIAYIPKYTLSKYAYNSVFGRVEYDYQEKYFVDGSVRYDSSSRFGEDNRGATFWSVGAMWNLSKEHFLRNNRTVSDLSLKLSYGTQGNSGIGDYDQYEVIAASQYPYNGNPAWNLSSAGNPQLAWEQQGILTVGASATLWRKLTLGVDWYRRQTTDMLMPKPMAPSSGVSSLIWNIGAMRNTGVDVTLNYDIFANKDWYVNFHATFNYNKNQLTELWEPGLKESTTGDGLTYYVVGKPVNEFYTKEWRGVNPDTGEPQWTAEGGGITTDYNQAIDVDLDKSSIPPYSGGFGFNVMWKGIGLTADFAWTAGAYALNNTLFFTANTYSGRMFYNQSEQALDYWKKPGDVTKYPALQYESQFDSHLIEDASFLRLKNIQISYTLPQSLLANSRFLKGFKVYVGARNLFTITGYDGIDPEAATAVGSEIDVYANTRQWTFGCEFKF